MLTLPRTARAAPDDIEATFKDEVVTLSPASLPLQQGMAHGNVADGDGLSAMVIRTETYDGHIRIHAGLFFTSVTAGCACHNDPTPMDEQAEYCEVLFEIERPGGATRVSLRD